MTTQSPPDASEFPGRTVALIDSLVEQSEALELGPPPPTLMTLRDKLVDDEHRVIVCGAAKRGKSSFCNGMIGAHVLPTAEAVATCQPFYVRSADKPGYRLRFEDGTARDIGPDELAAYGSQVVADAGEAGSLEGALRWIEVDMPTRFLPAGLAIVDLPGTDALYAAHAEITRRFVPLADAVLFVLDSGQPVGRLEIELLERLLEVTSRIFFIQTKIDQHDRDTWEQTRRRSEAILSEHFDDRLGNPRVWPVSSTNLLAAATSDGSTDALMLVSRYQELAAALRGFLAEVCAAPRAVAALVLAARHHQACQRALRSRLESLCELSEHDARLHRESVARRRNEFQDAWGENGKDRTRLVQGVRRVASLSKQELRESLLPSGPVALDMDARIDALRSVGDANKLGATLAADVVAAGMDQWNRVCELATRQYAELLSPLIEASEDLAPAAEVEAIEIPEHESRAAHTDDSLYDRLRGTYGYSMPMYIASGIAMGVVGGPIALAAGAGGLLWAFARGWKFSAAQKTKTAKNDLQRQTRSVLQRVSNHFLMVDLSEARFSRVDEYFSETEKAMTERVDAIVKQRIDAVRGELAHLEAHAQFEAEEREAAASALRSALHTWDELAHELGSLLRDERCRPHLAALTREAEPSEAHA